MYHIYNPAFVFLFLHFCIYYNYTATIGQLEATKLQHESTIRDLETELSKLRDRLAWLEKERTNLERQKSDLNASQLSQLRSLEKVRAVN